MKEGLVFLAILLSCFHGNAQDTVRFKAGYSYFGSIYCLRLGIMQFEIGIRCQDSLGKKQEILLKGDLDTLKLVAFADGRKVDGFSPPTLHNGSKKMSKKWPKLVQTFPEYAWISISSNFYHRFQGQYEHLCGAQKKLGLFFEVSYNWRRMATLTKLPYFFPIYSNRGELNYLYVQEENSLNYSKYLSFLGYFRFYSMVGHSMQASIGLRRYAKPIARNNFYYGLKLGGGGFSYYYLEKTGESYQKTAGVIDWCLQLGFRKNFSSGRVSALLGVGLGQRYLINFPLDLTKQVVPSFDFQASYNFAWPKKKQFTNPEMHF